MLTKLSPLSCTVRSRSLESKDMIAILYYYKVKLRTYLKDSSHPSRLLLEEISHIGILGASNGSRKTNDLEDICREISFPAVTIRSTTTTTTPGRIADH